MTFDTNTEMVSTIFDRLIVDDNVYNLHAIHSVEEAAT
jgi:hypothetical protein